MMASKEDVELLIEKGKYKNAIFLAEELNDKEFLTLTKARVALLKGNAVETLKIINSSPIRESDEMKRLLGYAYFNEDSFDLAYRSFLAVKEKTADDDFFLTLLATMHNDVATAKEYLRSAFAKDRERVQKLMSYFYDILIAPHPDFTANEKMKLSRLLKEQKI
ncbi:MAG: hypothetical protein D6769_01525 [Methanobacteriota archaeon]|nr:MAG: hypothetical protein D6769_01525 [Euryarchaeota archaeon]